MPQNITVVVLGDIGRSPRMQYHAASFLKEGYNVDIVGYSGSKPIEYLRSHQNCRFRFLAPFPQLNKYFPALLIYSLKVIWQIVTLAFALLLSRYPDHLLVQTPPAIPALAVCWLHCRTVRSRFIIDWHNYAYSIMALTHGNGHVLVGISKLFEGFFGRRADANLCVTKAMKDDLRTRWNINPVTLYDRPPQNFSAITDDEKCTLVKKYKELSSAGFLENGKLNPNRPALLVSSTSWTEDEDFSILLDALREYDASEGSPPLPRLVCVITGRGPLRETYMEQVAAHQWQRVSVLSLWLEPEDYPRLLATADLGVSLHTSSSGLDLPMKVVDMFGCGLPVAALQFNCLNELVRHNENGLVFSDSNELASSLLEWFREFPKTQTRDRFTKAIEQFQSLRWHDNWKIQAFPVFNRQNN